MTLDPYTEEQRRLQDRFDTRRLADRLASFAADTVTADTKAFIESRDFFFLATVDATGMPTCSFKGGPAGFVRALDEHTLAFPSYDGNGMFLSMGNIDARPPVGMLFIDFETKQRVRVQGMASVTDDDPMLHEFPGAQLLVRVAVGRTFVNCARYIPRMARVDASPYLPREGEAPRFAAWKRLDVFGDVLPERDAAVAAGLPPLTLEEYLVDPE